MMTQFYRVEITSYPEGAVLEEITDEAGDTWQALDPDWEPEGWLADDDTREWWVSNNSDPAFYWPSTKTWWRSRGTAVARKRLIESYGATAEVIVSDPIVWRTPELLRERRIAELEAELAELQAAA
jgi:hypothetical protein